MLNKKIILAAGIHLILSFTIYWILYTFKIIETLPNHSNLLNWDAEWFDSIRLNGYVFREEQMSNLAFFPLFPYLWKFSLLGPIGISILNLCIFIVTLSFLFSNFKLHYEIAFFLFSIASLIFFAVPYSESIFFLFATFILIGYKTKNTNLTLLGFFCASLIKSISMVFVPAIIISFILIKSKRLNFLEVRKEIGSLLATLLGLMVAVLIQHQQTGKLFHFIDVQIFWGRRWTFPSFPLTSTYPERTMGIDGIAFVIGVLAIFYCIKWFIIFLQGKMKDEETNINVDRYVVFSVLCLAGITILDACFTFKINGNSNIWSVNRHIMCSPFVMVFLIWFYKENHPRKNESLFIGFIVLSGIYWTGVYRFPNLTLYYFLFFFSYAALKFYPTYGRYLVVIYLFNTILQVIFYVDFLNHLWIG